MNWIARPPITRCRAGEGELASGPTRSATISHGGPPCQPPAPAFSARGCPIFRARATRRDATSHSLPLYSGGGLGWGLTALASVAASKQQNRWRRTPTSVLPLGTWGGGKGGWPENRARSKRRVAGRGCRLPRARPGAARRSQFHERRLRGQRRGLAIAHADGVPPGIERRLGQSPPFAERADGLPATAELPQGVAPELPFGRVTLRAVARGGGDARHAGILTTPAETLKTRFAGRLRSFHYLLLTTTPSPVF
jgi:hypothetical protein